MTTDGTNGVLQIISNPIRKSAIKSLKGNSMVFSEVMRACGLNPNYDSGPFYYHLSVLLDSNIVEKRSNKYQLTQFGNTIADFIGTLQRESAFLLKANEPQGGERMEKTQSKRLGQAVIKYIIAKGHDWDKCTELAISEGLGIQRDVLRGILDELVDLHVLQIREAGNIKPFELDIIGAAFDYMSLSFTKGELNDLLSVKEGKMDGDNWIVSGNVECEVDGKKINRYRGQAAYTALGVLIGRFFDYNAYIDSEWESIFNSSRVEKAFGKKTLKDLELLIPENTSFEKIIETWPFPTRWINKDLQYMEEMPPNEDIRKMIIKTYEMYLHYAMRRLKGFASFLNEKGYEGLHAFLRGKQAYQSISVGGNLPTPDWRFHDEYIWATTLALRDGCKIGEKLGANQNLLREARELADALDMALEKKYKGAKVEGSNMVEWYQTNKSVEFMQGSNVK